MSYHDTYTTAGVVATRNETGSTNQTTGNVGDDRSVQIGHEHNVELGRPGSELHAAIVDDHVLRLDAVRKLLPDLSARLEKQTVRQLPARQ